MNFDSEDYPVALAPYCTGHIVLVLRTELNNAGRTGLPRRKLKIVLQMRLVW